MIIAIGLSKDVIVLWIYLIKQSDKKSETTTSNVSSSDSGIVYSTTNINHENDSEEELNENEGSYDDSDTGSDDGGGGDGGGGDGGGGD